MKLGPWIIRVAAVSALALGAAACSKSTTSPDNATPASCDGLADANAQLETALYNLSFANPQRPADINLSVPLAKFEQVLTSDPSCAQANFGAAVLGLLSLSYDSEVNAAFDEWKTYLQARVPFQVGAATAARRSLMPLGVPTTFVPGSAAYRLPFDLVPLSLLAQARASQVAVDPQISRTQAILRDRALPKLTQAIARLDAAARTPGFRFVVTPLMQGDAGATPVEIDRTDLLALKAAAEMLAAGCHMAVSYDLGFVTYDDAGLVAALSPGGSWLKLASGGAGHMAGAQASMVASIEDVRSSLSSLVSETDPQDDDLIKRGPGGLTTAEIDSVLSRLDQVKQGLTVGFTMLADWDQNSGTPDSYLNIRCDRLFTSPVPDWKALLPGYTVAAVTRALDRGDRYEWGSSVQSVQIDTLGWYYGSHNLSVHPYGTYEDSSGSPELQAALRAAANEQYLRIHALSGFGGVCYINTSFPTTYLNPGRQGITVSWWAYYTFSATQVYVPEITWAANSYPEWIWPDPTMHGLLPGIATSDQFLGTFGYDPASWSKTVVLDWTAGPVIAARARPVRRR